MSWGGIDIGLLMNLANKKNGGEWYQLEFDFPQMFYIPLESVNRLRSGLSYSVGSGISSSIGTIDHPQFTELREYLGKKNLIEIERKWTNGDVVLKPFYLNEIYFEPGEQFSCASAMRYTLKHGNDKAPSPSKN
jgi:hypothetical protein